MNNLTLLEIILIIYILLNWFLMIMFAISFNIGQEKLEKTITNILADNILYLESAKAKAEGTKEPEEVPF